MKVVYILGFPRCGSSILGACLGGCDGVFHAGELHYLWERNLIHERRMCGCGKPLRSCELWGRILATPPLASWDPAAALSHQRRAATAWRAPKLLLRQGRPGGRWAALEEAARARGDLYRAIAEVTGAHAIVDSSKWVFDAALVASIPDVTTYLVHLVRDPRAVLYSRQRNGIAKRKASSVRLEPMHLLCDAAGWALSNLGADLLRRRVPGRHMLIRYEAFARRPRTTVAEILDLVELRTEPKGFIGEEMITLFPNHTVGGNKARFRSGLTRIGPDNRWHEELTVRAKLSITALTLPSLLRYGYPVGPNIRTSVASTNAEGRIGLRHGEDD